MDRRTVLAAAAALGAGAVVSLPQMRVAQAAEGWQLRWAPEPAVHGLGAFEGVEDDRANSHPAGQPHIFVESDHYRFNMHLVDRDTMTDRQRQEVKGMHWNGDDVILLKGETWLLTHSMFIPSSLKATTTFTHIMQTKAPGTDTLPMLTMSLRRYGSVPRIELKAFEGDVTIGVVDLAPLQNKWIDVELEMTIGDASTGRVRWALRDNGTTIIDVTRTGVDNFLQDRVRPKWGIYRSLGDTSGSLQDCYQLIRDMRAYQWTSSAPPSTVRYEAEQATISQGAVESNHLGFTGTGFVNLDNVTGSYLQFAVSAPTAGPASLTLRYANGTTTDRPMDVRVNGALVASGVSFPSTFTWDDWETRTVTASLVAGTNTVRFTATTANGGPNMDHLDVQLLSAPPPPIEIQAESGTISQGAVESNHLGFTGTGFVNLDNVTGSYVQFAVSSPTAGARSLGIRFANGTTVNRPMSVTVNGTVVATPAFAPTANWDTWAVATVPVTLTAGANTIRLTSTTANGGPNLDRINLT
jgi:Carbohydrate binding module (family 6)